jgi:hypothetical protein
MGRYWEISQPSVCAHHRPYPPSFTVPFSFAACALIHILIYGPCRFFRSYPHIISTITFITLFRIPRRSLSPSLQQNLILTPTPNQDGLVAPRFESAHDTSGSHCFCPCPNITRARCLLRVPAPNTSTLLAGRSDTPEHQAPAARLPMKDPRI